MANELAAVKGELSRLDEHLALLNARREDLRTLQESLELVGQVLGAQTLAVSLPPVRAHRGRRGTLIGFLRVTLRGVAPNTLTTRVLAKTAAEALGFKFETDKHFADFIDNNVSRALRKLVAAGLIERVNDDREALATGGEWRWKAAAGAAALLAPQEAV